MSPNSSYTTGESNILLRSIADMFHKKICANGIPYCNTISDKLVCTWQVMHIYTSHSSDKTKRF